MMAPMDPAPVNILLVDDLPANLTALAAILESPAYNLVKAGSGTEALRHLLQLEFAVVLLDVVMPEMNGFEVAALIKRRERLRNVPIIFLTAEAHDLCHVGQAYGIGAVDYLQKPLDPAVVRAKVAVFAELFQCNRQIRRQAEQLIEQDRKMQDMQLADMERTSAAHYRHLAEAIPQIVWTATPDGAVDYYNQRWFSYTGLTPEQSLGWAGLSAVHPDDAGEFLQRWQDALRRGVPFEAECRLRDAAEGTYCRHLARAHAERDAAGQIIGWVGTYTDIEYQERARATFRQFRDALDQFAECVWFFDPETLQVSYANWGMETYLGYSGSELLQMRTPAFLPLDDEAGWRSRIAPLLTDRHATVTFNTLLRGNHEVIHPVDLSLRYIAPLNEAGRILAIARDTSAKRHAEAERCQLLQAEHEARAEAEAALRHSEVLVDASSEIQALLADVRQLLGALRTDRTAPAPGSGRLDLVDQQVTAAEHRLARLSRLLVEPPATVGATPTPPQPEPVELTSLWLEAVDAQWDALTRAGCRVEISAEAPVVGMWLRPDIQALASELLTAACRGGSAQGVLVAIEQVGATARLLMRTRGPVSDSVGPWPTGAHACRLRLDACRPRVGTLGGTLRVVDLPDGGCECAIELPLGLPETPSAAVPVPAVNP